MRRMIFILLFVIMCHSFGAEKPGVRKAVDTNESYDEVVIDIGSVHQYVCNSTLEKATGTDDQTFIIGHSRTKDQPSMMWLEGGYDKNHYLYLGIFWVGYNNNTIRFSTETSDDFMVFRNDFSKPSPFEVTFSMTDELANPEDKVGVKCLCRVHAWPESYRDDYIIYEYHVINQSGMVMEDVYTGLHMDYDVSYAAEGTGVFGCWRDDLVDFHLGTDSNGHPESISYMYDWDNPNISGDDIGGHLIPKESLGFIGSRVLESPETELNIPANQQSGHWWWDWGSDPNTGDDFYRIMSSGHFIRPPPSPHDYRVFQTVGPWGLEPRDTLHVAFAIGIGEGLHGLRANLQTAYDQYWNGFEGPSQPSITDAHPPGDSLIVHLGDTVHFSVRAVDKDGDLIDFAWWVDGDCIDEAQSAEFLFVSEDYSMGFHEIVGTASDHDYVARRSWAVEILPTRKYKLYPCFPNPFNSATRILFELKESGMTRVNVYDARGRPVRQLFEGSLAQGKQELVWDAKDDEDSRVPSGLYFYQIRAGDFRATGKMILVE